MGGLGLGELIVILLILAVVLAVPLGIFLVIVFVIRASGKASDRAWRAKFEGHELGIEWRAASVRLVVDGCVVAEQTGGGRSAGTELRTEVVQADGSRHVVVGRVAKGQRGLEGELHWDGRRLAEEETALPKAA